MANPIVLESALHESLEKVSDRASLEQWQRRDAGTRENKTGKSIRAIMEAAASDPIGFTLLARRIARGETYRQALQSLSSVRIGKISNEGAERRVRRLSCKLRAAVLE